MEGIVAEEPASVGGVVVGLYSSTHVLLVIEEWYGEPKWKFPGGGVHAGETIKQAGAREHEEETGVKIRPRMLRDSFPRQGEKRFVFAQVATSKLRGLASRGRDGEIPRMFTFEEAAKLPNLLDQHREFLAFLERRAHKQTEES